MEWRLALALVFTRLENNSSHICRCGIQVLAGVVSLCVALEKIGENKSSQFERLAFFRR